jgi:hypothetical protein
MISNEAAIIQHSSVLKKIAVLVIQKAALEAYIATLVAIVILGLPLMTLMYWDKKRSADHGVTSFHADASAGDISSRAPRGARWNGCVSAERPTGSPVLFSCILARGASPAAVAWTGTHSASLSTA